MREIKRRPVLNTCISCYYDYGLGVIVWCEREGFWHSFLGLRHFNYSYQVTWKGI